MRLELLKAPIIFLFMGEIDIFGAKIRQFSVFLPEIKINRQHFSARATDLKSMLFVLEPGYGNLFHHPAKRTVKGDHIIIAN